MPEDERIIIRGYKDIPPVPVSRGRMSVNDTGSWRNAEPVYINHTPPCSFNCPAGNDVVGFLLLTAEGKFSDAWKLILDTSPFPAICGRVCPHPCEIQCNREQLGGSINIHSIERFLADYNSDAIYNRAEIKYPKQKVAVIGSGPAGLSCAYQLSKSGYPVTVFEQLPCAGGMMRVGIPQFRLPKKVLEREINTICQAGVQIKTGITIGRDIEFNQLRKNFSALFIAVGFHQSYALGIEGEKHPDVVTGINFLRKVALKEKVSVKEKVLVIGGGNTAVDTARTALRLGARVTILYRRTRNEMPAIPDEVEELLEEGIPIEFLTAPVKIYSSGGRIAKVECIRMKLGEPDSTGRARPLPIEGSNFLIDADQIFTAIGESADTSFLPFDLKIGREGIIADEFGRTNLPRVFAGGDVATGAGTVCAAIGSGRKTAIAIQKYLQAEDINSDDLLPPSLKGVNPKIVTLKDLNTDYIEIAPRVRMKPLSPLKRKNSFTEIHRLLTEKEALFEAQRCISCGTCPQCDNCYIFCPDNAVQHSQVPGEKYIIDIKHCKGCGLCVAECPRFCLELHPVH